MIRNTPFGKGKFKLDASSLTIDEKKWLGEQAVNGTSTVKRLNEQFGISSRTLQKYAKLIREDIPIREIGGRPTKLEDSVIRNIKLSVDSGRLSLRSEDFNEKVIEGLEETAEIRKKRLSKDEKRIVRRTYSKILDILGCTGKNA